MVFTVLNDAHLVRKFQSFCGLERVNQGETCTAENHGNRAPQTPPSSADSLRRQGKTFLKGDKGIDAIFSAVDRDSRFISQDELVSF